MLIFWNKIMGIKQFIFVQLCRNTQSMKEYLSTNLGCRAVKSFYNKKKTNYWWQLGNLRETHSIRHFVTTRSVKRSEASSLASGVCRLPFRRSRPSSRRPFAHATASLTPLRPSLWSHRVRHRAPHSARLHRAAPSRVESRYISSHPFVVFRPLACRHEPPLCAHGRA